MINRYEYQVRYDKDGRTWEHNGVTSSRYEAEKRLTTCFERRGRHTNPRIESRKVVEYDWQLER